MKKKTEDNAVILATNEVDAAIESLEEHGPSYAAYERLCRAMSAACKAYADQHFPLPAQAMQPFPGQAAEQLHRLLEDLLAGHLTPMARSLVGRSGARGRRLWEKDAVQAACKYMQAVKKGWIDDHGEVVRVAALYGVSRPTAQAWHRNEKRDLLPSVDDTFARDVMGPMIRNNMLGWAEHYSRFKQKGM